MNNASKGVIAMFCSIAAFVVGSLISIDNPANLAVATFGAPSGIMFVGWPVMAILWSKCSWKMMLAVMIINSLSGILQLFVFNDFVSMLQLQHGFLGALSAIYSFTWICVSVYLYFLISCRAEVEGGGR